MGTTSQNLDQESSERLAAQMAAWRRQVEAELKGAPFDKKLVTRTPEGIALQPLYTRADVAGSPDLDQRPGEAPFRRGFRAQAQVGRRWECCQEILAQRPYEFNRALLADLMVGQDSVALTPDLASRSGLDPDQAGADIVGEGGVSLVDTDDVEAALRGVDLTSVPLHVRGGAEPVGLAALVLAVARARGVSWSTLRGSITADPIAHALETGALPETWEAAFDHLAGWTRWAEQNAPSLRTVGIEAGLWHEAGGAATHELAYALAAAVDYVRALANRGLPLEVIIPRLRVTFAAGPQFFMEVAKFRAWRLLWTRALAAMGAKPELAAGIAVHARTGRWNQTLLDPQVNYLRATTAALSAVLGDVDSLHVSPFDEATGRTDDISRRIARNVHTLLAEEFHFTMPVDPAGGSWYLESITDQLARKAWELFQEVERSGGLVAALGEGMPQRRVAACAADKTTGLATRRTALVGTNIFPNSRDKLPASRRAEREALRITRGREASERRGSSPAARMESRSWPECLSAAIAAARDGATIGQLTRLARSAQEGPRVTPVAAHRAAEPFEALRARAAARKERPKVFLAKMGPVAQHKARADFTVGFFAVGGFEPLAKRTFESADEAAVAAIESGASVAVLCSTDETYPELVPAFARRMKADKPAIKVVLAGLPNDPAVVQAYRDAGVDDFIHVRANVAELLGNLLTSLEATK
jgi:methylmalonyl-CoA mutase